MDPIKKDPKDFTMLTRGYIREIREMAKRAPAAFQVFLLLTERMNKTNAVVISWATIGQILDYSRATVYRAISLLEDEKWVQVVKVGSANGYIVNSKVIWRDHSGKRYGSFFAEVVVSEDEQSRKVEDWDNVELRHVPVLHSGEIPISGNEELPPPDQADLLPPDPIEFPRRGD